MRFLSQRLRNPTASDSASREKKKVGEEKESRNHPKFGWTRVIRLQKTPRTSDDGTIMPQNSKIHIQVVDKSYITQVMPALSSSSCLKRQQSDISTNHSCPLLCGRFHSKKRNRRRRKSSSDLNEGYNEEIGRRKDSEEVVTTNVGSGLQPTTPPTSPPSPPPVVLPPAVRNLWLETTNLDESRGILYGTSPPEVCSLPFYESSSPVLVCSFRASNTNESNAPIAITRAFAEESPQFRENVTPVTPLLRQLPSKARALRKASPSSIPASCPGVLVHCKKSISSFAVDSAHLYHDIPSAAEDTYDGYNLPTASNTTLHEATIMAEIDAETLATAKLRLDLYECCHIDGRRDFALPHQHQMKQRPKREAGVDETTVETPTPFLFDKKQEWDRCGQCLSMHSYSPSILCMASTCTEDKQRNAFLITEYNCKDSDCTSTAAGDATFALRVNKGKEEKVGKWLESATSSIKSVKRLDPFSGRKGSVNAGTKESRANSATPNSSARASVHIRSTDFRQLRSSSEQGFHEFQATGNKESYEVCNVAINTVTSIVCAAAYTVASTYTVCCNSADLSISRISQLPKNFLKPHSAASHPTKLLKGGRKDFEPLAASNCSEPLRRHLPTTSASYNHQPVEESTDTSRWTSFFDEFPCVEDLWTHAYYANSEEDRNTSVDATYTVKSAEATPDRARDFVVCSNVAENEDDDADLVAYTVRCYPKRSVKPHSNTSRSTKVIPDGRKGLAPIRLHPPGITS